MNATRWTLIGASAGTGKTHRLTNLVWDRLGTGAQPPESLVAMTFTEKAAAELGDRIRTRLFAGGAADTAQRMSLGYIGTVHAIGLRLVREHALDAGASPDLRLLSDHDGRLLRGLLERAVPEGRQRELDGLAARLGIHWDFKLKRTDWHRDVFALVEGARANRIDADALAAMAERSWHELAERLDPADDTRDFDGEMLALIDKILDECRNGDGTSGTAKALEALREHGPDIKRSWKPWAKFESLHATKASKPWFDRLNALAEQHLAHPRLHTDLRTYLVQVYAAAADMLRAYQAWKAALHVVDYTDMLELALTMLDEPTVFADLAARLQLIVVDELQDSTPLQLALFTRLHASARDSTWVGDPKQCIFEWNGADPTLMDDLLLAIKQRQGMSEQLTTNWRSRPELVRLTSELFASAFAAIGVDPREVRTTAHRTDPAALAPLPPVGIAAYMKPLSSEEALAQTVAGVLATPELTPVLDRVTGDVRPVRPEDIAVLVATNVECEEVADRLVKLGLRAATARNGLLATPEAYLALAALTLLVTPDNPLAEAELEALHAFTHHEGVDVEARRASWLAQRIAQVERDEATSTEPRSHWMGAWAERLAPVRAELSALSPAAALERCFEVLDAGRLVLGWPDAPQRLANLDALRGLAQRYESEMQGGGGAVTLSGLIRAWSAARSGDDDALLDDAQHVSEGQGVVTVTTYHKAKGLEWPVVILGSLDRSERRTPFDVHAESDAEVFDLDRPLHGRWLRTWPWPYADMGTGTLRERVMASPVGQAVTAREKRERVRVLYVGFTRARDHLILSLEMTARGAWISTWLNELVAADGAIAWRLDGAPGAELTIRTPEGETLAVRTRRAAMASPMPPERAVYAHARPATITPRPPRALSPSGIDAGDVTRLALTTLVPGQPSRLGGTLYVAPTTAWNQLGTALHAFLASDDASVARPARVAHAAHLLAAAEVDQVLAADDAVLAADRLRAFVIARWPECDDRARWHHEVPITATLSDGPHARKVQGVIDLLLDTHAGWVLIDHKSFPVEARLAERALAIAPQLALYRHALTLADTRAVASVWLHFPIAAAMLELVAT